MITVLLDDPIICDLPIKVIKIDEFLSINERRYPPVCIFLYTQALLKYPSTTRFIIS